MVTRRVKDENPSAPVVTGVEVATVPRPTSYFQRSLILGLLLVIASHFFVSAFAKIAYWELHLTGGSKLAVPLLQRCAESNGREPHEACQLDCCWYSSVIRSGYDHEPRFGRGSLANWNFFPLFPLFASAWYYPVGNRATYAAVLGSKLALFCAILAFLFMVRSECDEPGDALLAGIVVAFNPAIIYAHAGYAEPLYFALAATGLALLERKKWVAAGVAGGLLSATRMMGVVFGVAYAIAAFRSGAVLESLKKRRFEVIIGGLLCPFGLSAFMLYLYRHTGDALASVHIYAGWRLSSGNPVSVLWEALLMSEWDRFWALVAIGALAISVWLVTQRQYEKAAFLALAVLMPSTAEVTGMQRFVFWQPPTLYAAFRLVKSYPRLRPVYFLVTGGMAAVMILLWFLGGRSVA